MRMDPSNITGWKLATKVRPIKAKPLISLLVDRTVTNKFLVDTLEGNEPLGDGVCICVGEAGDAWQQSPKKLLQKYVVKEIDKDGWMVCEPIPDNAVECCEVIGHYQEFSIVGIYGQTIGGELNVQTGVTGDFICRSRTDSKDVWIVKRKLFLNTYAIKS